MKKQNLKALLKKQQAEVAKKAKVAKKQENVDKARELKRKSIHGGNNEKRTQNKKAKHVAQKAAPAPKPTPECAEESIPTKEVSVELAAETTEAPATPTPVDPLASVPSRHRKTIYAPGARLLLLGEGNLSFARALMTLHGHQGSHITASNVDSRDVIMAKYPDAAENEAALLQSGAQILYDIDASKLDHCKALRHRTFDGIVFNFPHVGAGIKDQDRNILSNQRMLLALFQTAPACLADAPDAFLDITLKVGEPYDSWRVKGLAKETKAWVAQTAYPFYPQVYPGYTHRRTLGFQPGKSKGENEEILPKSCRTHRFVRGNIDDQKDLMKKQKHRNTRLKEMTHRERARLRDRD